MVDYNQGWDGPNNQPHFDINGQQAAQINNVGRDQHIAYIRQQRESFLREVAATRTKARWLIWVGLAIFVVGFGMFASAIIRFMTQAAHAIGSNDFGPPESPFGQDVAGIPFGLLGWAIAAVGVLLLIIGIVLHIVATSKRKRVDRELPLPVQQWPGQQWPAAGYGGPR